MWNPASLSSLTSCYSLRIAAGVHLLSPTHLMSLHVLFLLPRRSIPFSLPSNLPLILKTQFKVTYTMTFQTPACPQVELIPAFISAICILCTSTFAFITLDCDVLFTGLSSHLTESTVEWLDHVYSFLHSQPLVECLTLSKCC